MFGKLLNARYAGLAALGLALAATVAAGAWALRGPDAALLPAFAETPVTLPDGRVLYVATFEVSVAEWQRCADAGACIAPAPLRPGLDAQTTPMTGINWTDAQAYVVWVHRAARFPLRLPTYAEWQVMADPVLPAPSDPLFTDPSLAWAAAYLTTPGYARALRPRGSFSTSAEGIADLDGPVWEWTSDCYDPETAPGNCPAFFAAGLHKSVISVLTRDPARGGCAVGAPPAHLGLRLVSDRPAA